ncbi:MAG: DUF2127 domain-containing protein [bacterium]|nr:DUF2127 domain-containing protein [bacterium]
MYKKLHLHLLFEVGVVIKGLHALLELVTAFVVYFLGSSALLFVTRISENELADDPNDIFMNLFVNQATHVFTSARGFVVIYLIVSAIINLILVGALLSNRLKAYPVSIGIVSLFVFYQMYRISITHSPWLTLFTLFDIAVMYLIYEEYKHQKGLREQAAAPIPSP